ncbi:hypothetical protein LCGC14_2552220 [marine sediment metagenome]|uniref:Uncharacterized protein n=1 Tax=marine sediment metagenome TaxID=412755 RepID=A0A0F9BAH4_9ZZZZ
MYRIESTIVEKLKEQELNATDLLCEHAKNRKSKTESKVIYYEISDEILAKLKIVGINAEQELIDSIQAAVHDMGGGEIKIIRRKEE